MRETRDARCNTRDARCVQMLCLVPLCIALQMPVHTNTGLRAVSKDLHHRRLWGVPPGTSFGALDPFVNPYYRQPIRMRRITPEEEACLLGRGWTHSAGKEDIHSLPVLMSE